MKRRNFLYASALSVAGAFKASALPLSFLHSKQDSLSKYLNVVGALPQNQFLASDQELNIQLQTASTSLLKSGYKALGTTHYYCNQNQVAICPMALQTPEAGMIDLSVLFFTKDTSTAHSWKYTHTFSGFELEAIVRAIDTLESKLSEQKAIDLFIPAYVALFKKRPFIIQTAKGQLELKVQLVAQDVWLDLKVFEEGTPLIANHYQSSQNQSSILLV